MSEPSPICPACMHDMHEPHYCHECGWDALDEALASIRPEPKVIAECRPVGEISKLEAELSRLRKETAELREALGFIARQKKAAEITSADLPEGCDDASELDWEGGFDACVDCARSALASVEAPGQAEASAVTTVAAASTRPASASTPSE